MADAKGLLLVFNQGNARHNRPKDFRLLTGSVLRKRDKDSKLGFLISTVRCTPVYFSYDSVKTEQEAMLGTAAIQDWVERRPDRQPYINILESDRQLFFRNQFIGSPDGSISRLVLEIAS
jgi:hypothetical protein